MQNQKVSTLTGIVIILATAVVLFGGVFGWGYYFKQNFAVHNPVVNNNQRPACVGEGGAYAAPATKADLCCEGLAQQPTTQSGTVGLCVKPANQTAGWKTYMYPSSESKILLDITFNYPSILGSPKIHGHITNRPESITEDWGGFIDFMPTSNIFDGGLKLECSLINNLEDSLDEYVEKQANLVNWDSQKELLVNGKKLVRIRFVVKDQYVPSYYSWYFIDLGNKKILRIGTSGDKKLSYDNNSEGFSTADKIISTFKFTK